MQKCLKEKCPNHCCSNKFKGLSNTLINTDKNNFVQIKLSIDEVNRIQKFGRGELIKKINNDYFLKLNSDNSCSAFKSGKCEIYEVRPDVCKLYPYYFDPFCGICIDKNCPGNFELNNDEENIYQLLKNRIDLFNNQSNHFFYDGYDLNNKYLKNEKYLIEFIKGIQENIKIEKSKITLIPYFNGKDKKMGGISVIILGTNFHFTCHTFCYKKTVFIDCFSKNNIKNELLKIINKYFKTKNFDLCKENSKKTGKFGKHLIFNTNKKLNFKDSKELINSIIETIKMTPICKKLTIYTNENNYDIIQPIAESHISIHKNNKIITIDIFSCKFFDERKIFNLLKNDVKNVRLIDRGIYFK